MRLTHQCVCALVEDKCSTGVQEYQQARRGSQLQHNDTGAVRATQSLGVAVGVGERGECADRLWGWFSDVW